MSSAVVLSIKKRALQAKNAGDIEEAKRLLMAAKQLETLQDPLELKKLALAFKNEGDMDAAKEAVQKARQYESAAASAGNAGETAAAAEEPQQEEEYENPVNDAIDAANLDELTGGSGSTKFTDEEMLDVETMADMKDAGMDIPSQEAYLERAKFHKQKAIAHRDKKELEKAKARLRLSKQFEAAATTLHSDGGGGGILEEEEDNEDYSLLDELMGGGGGGDSMREDDGFMNELFGTDSNAVTLEDLDDLDPGMLRDMMEAGMDIPDVDNVLERSKEKKAAALVFKKDGNIIAAKAALEESKRLESKAAQLSDLLTRMTSAPPTVDDPEAMLEAMMAAENGSAAAPKKAPAAAAAPPKEQLKPAHEYRALAVKFKNEGNIPDATANLRLYKQALAAEASAANAARRQECQQALDAELIIATEQLRQFSFYKRFVDNDSNQVTVWRKYLRECQEAVPPSKVVANLQRTNDAAAKQLDDQALGFVGHVMDPKEERIEVAVLEAQDLLSNKTIKELMKSRKDKNKPLNLGSCVRLQVSVQLPPEEGSTDQVTDFCFKPTGASSSRLEFASSTEWVNTKRGTSRFAKTILRKLGQKRVMIDVMYAPPKSGFFSSAPVEQLLGTAVVKLKDLLTENYIAGDFPLLDSSRRREVGGSVRLAIRTGMPFTTTEEEEEETPITATTGLSDIKLKPYPTFCFEREVGDGVVADS